MVARSWGKLRAGGAQACSPPHPGSLGWVWELGPAKPQTLSLTCHRAKLTCPRGNGAVCGASPIYLAQMVARRVI